VGVFRSNLEIELKPLLPRSHPSTINSQLRRSPLTRDFNLQLSAFQLFPADRQKGLATHLSNRFYTRGTPPIGGSARRAGGDYTTIAGHWYTRLGLPASIGLSPRDGERAAGRPVLGGSRSVSRSKRSKKRPMNHRLGCAPPRVRRLAAILEGQTDAAGTQRLASLA